MTSVAKLREAASQLRDLLQAAGDRIVLAESCTGGNIAATLAALPGISNHLCGSFVVYRNESKANWLGIDRTQLEDPEIGPVSQKVTRMLAESALRSTPEADIALAVTGHLGPGVAKIHDGVIFCALQTRRGMKVLETTGRLNAPSPVDAFDEPGRLARLQEATLWALENAVHWLANEPPSNASPVWNV